MANLKFYTVNDNYINFLRSDNKLNRVILDSKENKRVHERKYIGTVIIKNGFNYFVPLSSAKQSDYYINNKGDKCIRKNIIPIIRITKFDEKKNKMLLQGTLKLNNMIPVPNEETKYYNFNSESDCKYKELVKDEYEFVKAHQNLIIKNANCIYSQKIHENDKSPNYIHNTVDFKYAEQKCLQYCYENNLSMPLTAYQQLNSEHQEAQTIDFDEEELEL